VGHRKWGILGHPPRELHRVIPQDGAGRRNQEEERKKVSQLAEAIQNMQFSRSLASLTKFFKSRACFGISAL